MKNKSKQTVFFLIQSLDKGERSAKGKIPSIHSAINKVPSPASLNYVLMPMDTRDAQVQDILEGAELTVSAVLFATVVIREAIRQMLVVSIPGYESLNSIALVLHQFPILMPPRMLDDDLNICLAGG